VKEFVKRILSQEGQGVVVKDGYYPLPASIVAEELKKLD
jgi:phosphate transport system substrate-binding protein